MLGVIILFTYLKRQKEMVMVAMVGDMYNFR